MRLAQIRSVYDDACRVAQLCAGSSTVRQSAMILHLVLVPLRKRLFGRRPVAITIYSHDQAVRLHVRDAADIAILREIFVDNEYATSEELRAHHIVDIGGHAGFASVYFALRFPDAEIRTFEPDPENFALLKMNTAKFTRIAARQAAVTARGGATAFFLNESSISSSLERRDGGREIAVSSFSLDEILTEGPADLIKFDVEGAEYDIFSATEKVSACAAYVGELHYDLIGHTKQEFLALFPGYELLERQIGKQRSIVHLTARER